MGEGFGAAKLVHILNIFTLIIFIFNTISHYFDGNIILRRYIVRGVGSKILIINIHLTNYHDETLW